MTNVDNTISGAGYIGSSTLTLVNQAAGVIDATGGNALFLNTGANTIANAGLIETTGAGGLSIQSAVNNVGGVIQAGTGGSIGLSAVVIGGTLKTTGTGYFTSNAATLDGTASAFSNQAVVVVNANQSLNLKGSIANTGTIAIDAANVGYATYLTISKSTTLSGKGQVILDNSSNNQNQVVGGATAATLTNVDNTISGAGYIGSSMLTLVNQAAGVIDATGANGLTLNTGANTIANAGLIETTGAGGLAIQSATTNTGTVEALGTGALVIAATVTNTGAVMTVAKGGHASLQSGSVIGGTLSIAAGGLVGADLGASVIAADTFVNAGTVAVGVNANLSLQGSIANTGTIAIDAANVGYTTYLTISKSTTLSGKGQVILDDSYNNQNQVVGGATTATLTNVDNTISGAGYIGSSTLTLVNQAAGVIDATGANALTLNTGANTIANAGLIETTGVGGLSIQSAVNNVGGVIQAGTGGSIGLSAVVIGGTLKAAGTGYFTSNGATLDGTASALTNQGQVVINLNQALNLQGSIANSGTIAIDAANVGYTTYLTISQNTTLSGKGLVILDNSVNNENQVAGGAAAVTLTNVDNTISGAGLIGSPTLTLINQKAGVIDATGINALTLNTGANTIANAGLIETTGAGGLTIASATSNTGTLLAHTGTLTVAGSLTNLSGTALAGGTYQADAGATLELPQNTSIVTDRATIILNGPNSVIEAFNTTTSAEVTINSTLSTIASNGALEILGGRSWSSKLAIGNAGLLQLGGGKFATKSLSNTGTTTGYGTITAPLTNSGVLAAQANKTLSLQGGGLTNLATGTLTGGTYIVGAGATLQLQDNVSVSTLAATVDLAGTGATLQSLNTDGGTQFTLESSLTTIAAAGVLQILGTRDYTTAKAISNSGVIQLGGGTFTSASLANAAGSSLAGFGTVASSVNEAGAVTAAGGALSFTATGDTFATALAGAEIDFAGGTDMLQSTATLTAAQVGVSGGATVTLASAQTYAGTLVLGSGTIALGGNSLTLTGAGSTLAGAVSGGGSLVLSGGSDTFETGAGLDAATTLSITNNAAVAVGGAVSFAGPVLVAAGTSLTINKGAVLSVTGATSFGGALGGVGTLSLGGGATLTLTGSLADGGALVQAAGTTIAVGANTLTLSGAGSALAGSVTGAGSLVFAGGTQALNAGASLSVANWSLTGGTASVNLSLNYAGAFNESAGAVLAVATGDKLTLSKASTLAGTVDGAGTLVVANATIGGLTVGGAAILSVTGMATQSGAVTIGDATSAAATLSIAKGAAYTISGAVGIARGHATKSSLKVAGTLTRSGATGVSVVGLATSDTGLIEVAAGTLDFASTLGGTGSLKIDSGAVLEADSTAAASLSTTFNGTGATLALKNPAKFASTISGFAPGDTIDLLGKKATAASVNASDQLVIVNGATTVATLQLAGTYTGDTFSVTSDGAGGSNVTVSTGAMASPHAFVAAMAAVGGARGAAVSSPIRGEPREGLRLIAIPAHGAALA